MAMNTPVRIMPAEEIATRAAGNIQFLRHPDAATVFAERAMRLRQLAAGHTMGDFLKFAALLAAEQQVRLAAFPQVPIPDAAALDRAALAGLPPLPASEWPRADAWRDSLRALATGVAAQVQGDAHATLTRIAAASDDWLEQQADALLTGVMHGVDLAAAPVVGAALQVYWTHLLLATRASRTGKDEPFGRIADEGACPCCGSRPTASVTRTSGESLGQRYLHCSLCSLEWHMVRIRCTHCLGSKHVAYQSLDRADEEGAERDDSVAGAEAASRRAAQAAVQVETCDDCHHYLKIVHTDRDPMVDPVADDLASVTLDLLVSDAGLQRHGVNFLLLFGDPGPEPVPRPPEEEGP